MEQLVEFIINHWALSLALVLVSGALIAGEFLQRMSGVKQVGPAEATHMVNHKDALLLDVREKSEHQNGLLPGAVSIPLGEIEQRIVDLEKYRQRPLIVFCKNGQHGKRACGLLRKQGFESIYNLDGGLLAWQTANMPIQKTG